MLGLIICAYVLAAIVPGPGLLAAQRHDHQVRGGSGGSAVKALPLLLGLLLFCAGLRVRIDQAGRTLRQPRMVLIGVLANLAVPVAYIVMIALGLRHWHDMEEAQSLLVGLALVVAMPIAGSSAGWAQHNDADLSLSLGLVLLSTLLSPLTTPLALRSVGLVADGQPAVQLQHLASHGTGAFLALWVLVPTVLGILSRFLLGEKQVERCADAVKLVSTMCLFVLCYANAAVCLPMLVHQPDWDFLGIELAHRHGTLRSGLRLRLGHRPACPDRTAPARLAHVRPGHEQQWHWPGSGLDGARVKSDHDASHHPLQPGSTSGRRLCVVIRRRSDFSRIEGLPASLAVLRRGLEQCGHAFKESTQCRRGFGGCLDHDVAAWFTADLKR